MTVSEKHHRTSEPSQEQRAALDWLTRQLRFERLLEEVRGSRTR
jgi:hypothetical protein